jgi:hypothetical protein
LYLLKDIFLLAIDYYLFLWYLFDLS